MTHFNQLFADLNTIDYGLLCCDLYHLVDVPVEVINKDESHHSTDSDWKPILGTRNVTVRGEFTKELTDPLKTVFVLWDKAQWVRYHETDFGSVFFQKSFSNTWMDEENRETRIQDALSDLLALPKETVQLSLNRLLDFANRITDSLKSLLDIAPVDKRLTCVPLWWPLGNFERFHLHLAPSFNTVNYPPSGDKDCLYFGRSFLERYDMLVFKKVELIAFFVQKVRSLMSITIDVEHTTQAQQGNFTFNHWQGIDNYFNKMPLDEVEKWFMQLATVKNNKGETFLSEDEVRQFINRAFVEVRGGHAKLKFNRGSRTKGEVQTLFTMYYEHCTTGKDPVEKRSKWRSNYIRLLTDNFEDYEFEKIEPNFAKKYANKWITPS